MTPRIEILAAKKLVGKNAVMSLLDNKTTELWKTFMPQRRNVQNMVGDNLYSLQVYPPGYFVQFDASNQFKKWALVEVTDFNSIPPDLEPFTLEGGLYAVFVYRGAAHAAGEFFRFIFERWLPGSGYSVDERPHFEVMGTNYRNEGPDSEEEIWIPVKPRAF